MRRRCMDFVVGGLVFSWPKYYSCTAYSVSRLPTPAEIKAGAQQPLAVRSVFSEDLQAHDDKGRFNWNPNPKLCNKEKKKKSCAVEFF